MELALIVYGIQITGHLYIVAGVLFNALVFLLCIVGFVGIIWTFDSDYDLDEYKRLVRSSGKPLLLPALVITILAVLTPPKSTMYAMLAAYGGQSVLESESVQRLAPKSLELLEGYIDKHLEELSGE